MKLWVKLDTRNLTSLSVNILEFMKVVVEYSGHISSSVHYYALKPLTLDLLAQKLSVPIDLCTRIHCGYNNI